MTRTETSQWRKRPGVGESHWFLPAKKREKGSRPSFPSSWLTRACANDVAAMLPNAEMMMNNGRTFSPITSPNMFLKK